MTQEPAKLRKSSNAYSIFILVLTILSLAVMVVMLLPISDATYRLLSVYDNLICVIFLIDFFLNLRGAAKKSDYFIGQRGWLDLLGWNPLVRGIQIGWSLATGPPEPASRALLTWSAVKTRRRWLRTSSRTAAGTPAFLTILLTILVLTVSSVLVLQFKSKSQDANITTGGDALWYAIVTITTVGYGDFYPVTAAGQITAVFIMFMGVGIIGALASILASLLVARSSSAEESAAEAEATPAAAAATAAAPALSVQEELKAVKEELAVVRQMLEKMSAG